MHKLKKIPKAERHNASPDHMKPLDDDVKHSLSLRHRAPSDGGGSHGSRRLARLDSVIDGGEDEWGEVYRHSDVQKQQLKKEREIILAKFKERTMQEEETRKEGEGGRRERGAEDEDLTRGKVRHGTVKKLVTPRSPRETIVETLAGPHRNPPPMPTTGRQGIKL